MLNNYPLLDKYEKANFISHFLGLLIFILILPILIYSDLSEASKLIGSIVFSLGILSVYLASSIYHLALGVQMKMKWRKIDHMSIFLLIGGSYTAFILKYYSTEEGLWFLGLHWFLIFGGIISKIYLTGKLEVISTLFYILLGWMVVFIYKPITADMGIEALSLLALGGVFYTVGVLFYIWRKLPYHHAIWHFFVVGGSLSHYLSLCCD